MEKFPMGYAKNMSFLLIATEKKKSDQDPHKQVMSISNALGFAEAYNVKKILAGKDNF